MARDKYTSPHVKQSSTRVTPPRICTWDECEQQFPEEEFQPHLKIHSRDALSRWSCPSKCTWQGCKSKSRFKTIHQFRIHLDNIHTNLLVCTTSHCPHKKPFRNKHDLERHNSTKHSNQRPWECPYDSCPSEIRTFARKDKWLQHIQEKQHENDAFCPFYHCRLLQVQSSKLFKTRKEIKEHFKVHAGGDIAAYACALGSCSTATSQDRWTVLGLFKHLGRMHKIAMFPYELRGILQGSNRVLQIQHVPAEPLVSWIDCEVCASQREAQRLLSATTEHANLSNTTYL